MRWHGRRLSLLLLAVLGAAEPAELRAAPAKPPGKAAKSAVKPVPAKVEAARVDALMLEEVLKSVMTRYPPWLAALIEQDIAGGRLRQTLGAFDPSLSAKLGTQGGYYDADYADAGVEQALPFWGGSLYGGYRLSSGILPNYSKDRTQEDGELRFGGRLNLLRDGAIDRRRAAVFQARLDEELADPFILRQYLDFIRAATRAYVNWVASGLRLKVSEEILRVARERDGALGKQIEEGLSAPIVRTDNEQLVLSRSLEVVRAQRRLEAAAIELSLFLRDAEGRPVLAGRERLPEAFPVAGPVPAALSGVELLNASVRRPELRRLDLMMEKVSVDERLARNNLLPNLDLGLSAAREFGDGPYKDLERTELQAGIELKVPLGRNEAKGRLEVAAAQMDRLRQEAQFARDRIVAEVQDAFSAMEAAMAQISQNRRNVELAVKLEEAERFRFQEGASDLLALQIREQRTFEARLSEVEAVADYFRALAEYRAAVAADAPLPGRTGPIPPVESKPIPASGSSKARR